jgi:calcineurin-like phosphoesterase family protein
MTKLFTSDSHAFHERIIGYCDRPFKDRHEMNAAILKNWNSVVSPLDEVYHVGDVAVGVQPGDDLGGFLYGLNGKIHLVRGNHEKAAERYPKRFEWIKDYHELDVGKQRIVLFHYAMRVWHKSHRGSWHLYGHSHGDLPEIIGVNAFDIGMDCWGFTPLTFDQVRDRMEEKQRCWKMDARLDQSSQVLEAKHHGKDTY